MRRLSLLSLLVATALCAEAQTFTQITPLPTHMNLSGVFFTSPTDGWISGEAHTLFKTVDRGVSWTRVTVPGFASEPLYDVYFVTPQLGFLSGNSASTGADIYRTADGGATWQPVSSFPLGSSWYHIDFVNTTTGFMGANGGLVKTTDGGVNWSLRSGYPNCPIIYGMDFVDANNGVAGGHQLSTNQDGIFKTTDGGATWTLKQTGSANTVLYLTATTILADHGEEILRSVDGGNTWAPIGTVPTGLGSMAKLDTNTIVGVSLGGDVWRSADGGFTWSLRRVGISALPATWKVRFVDSLNGHVVGEGGSIYETSDGGLTWTTQHRGRGTEWNGIVAFDDTRVLLAGFHGYVQTTADAGAHWEAQLLDRPTFGRDTSFSDAELLGPNTAYVVGHWGSMFKTTDAGATWQDLSSSVNPSYYANAVKFTDANNGWLVGFDYNTGPKSYVRRTFDGGNTWVPAALNVPSLDVDFVGQTGYVLTTSQPFYKTTDGGTTWTSSLITTPTGPLFSSTRMSWVTPNVGYVAGFDGFLAKTLDGAATWNRVVPERANFVYLDVKALSSNEVWACGASQGGGNAVVMRSVDGGATWTTWQLPGTYTTPYRIAATPSYVYVTGYEGKTWRFDLGAVVAPSSFTIMWGNVISGSVQSLAQSDDERLRIGGATNGTRTTPHVQLEISGTSPLAQPSQIKFEVEARSDLLPLGGVTQRIELFNFATGQWVQIDERVATTADSTVSIAAQDPARFVQGATRLMRARVTWQGGVQFSRGAGSLIDQAVWRVR